MNDTTVVYYKNRVEAIVCTNRIMSLLASVRFNKYEQDSCYRVFYDLFIHLDKQ